MFYLWEEELNTYWDDGGSNTFTKTQLTFKVYALNSDKQAMNENYAYHCQPILQKCFSSVPVDIKNQTGNSKAQEIEEHQGGRSRSS